MYHNIKTIFKVQLGTLDFTNKMALLFDIKFFVQVVRVLGTVPFVKRLKRIT